MKLSEFAVGHEFLSGGRRWRCTDIGSRVVVAIRIDRVSIARARRTEYGDVGPIGGAEAEAAGWFEGPPYAVAEISFDEDDQEGCEAAPKQSTQKQTDAR